MSPNRRGPDFLVNIFNHVVINIIILSCTQYKYFLLMVWLYVRHVNESMSIIIVFLQTISFISLINLKVFVFYHSLQQIKKIIFIQSAAFYPQIFGIYLSNFYFIVTFIQRFSSPPPSSPNSSNKPNDLIEFIKQSLFQIRLTHSSIYR